MLSIDTPDPSAIMALAPGAQVEIGARVVYAPGVLTAAQEVAIRALVALRGWRIDGQRSVLSTLLEVPLGTRLEAVSLATLPVSTLSSVYRGLLSAETTWRLTDVVAGRPSGVPVRRVVYTWGMDPQLGPVSRDAEVRYFDTTGAIMRRVMWPTKTYGLPAGGAEGAFSARTAGARRRRNVVDAIGDLAYQAILAHIEALVTGGTAPLPPAAYAAPFAAATMAVAQGYQAGGGTSLSDSIAALAATGPLAWMDAQIPHLRWALGASSPVVASARAHMLDELVEPQ